MPDQNSTADDGDLRDNLSVSEDGKLKWFGSFEELKDLVSNSIMLTGKWSAPSRDCKLFKAENVEIRWYSKTKTLTNKGDKAEELKAKIMLEIVPNIVEQTEENEKDGGNALEQEGNQAKHGRGNSHVDGFAQVLEKVCDAQQQMHDKFECLYDEINRIKEKNCDQPGKDNKNKSDEYVNYLLKTNKELVEENKMLAEREANISYKISDLNLK